MNPPGIHLEATWNPPGIHLPPRKFPMNPPNPPKFYNTRAPARARPPARPHTRAPARMRNSSVFWWIRWIQGKFAGFQMAPPPL